MKVNHPQGDRGVKVAWKGETHYVLLDTQEHRIDADGVQANATCLVVKRTGEQDFSLTLPAGGQAAFRGQRFDGPQPQEVVVARGKVEKPACEDLMKESR